MSVFVCGLAHADDQPPPSAAPDKTSASAAPATPAANEGDRRINLTGYLWFPGVHGNIGGFGHDIGFKASPGDLLSHADLGLMGVFGDN